MGNPRVRELDEADLTRIREIVDREKIVEGDPEARSGYEHPPPHGCGHISRTAPPQRLALARTAHPHQRPHQARPPPDCRRTRAEVEHQVGFRCQQSAIRFQLVRQAHHERDDEKFLSPQGGRFRAIPCFRRGWGEEDNTPLIEGRKGKKNAAKTRTRRRERRSIPVGKAYIQSTFNNTIITLGGPGRQCHLLGQSGTAGFRGSRKSTAFAAQRAAEDAARQGKRQRTAPDRGLRQRNRAPAGKRQSARCKRKDCW